MSLHYFFLYCRPTDNTINLHSLKRTYYTVNFNNELTYHQLLSNLKLRTLEIMTFVSLFYNILILIK